MAKKIRLNHDDKIVKRLAGLLRINSDLLLLQDMIKRALEAKNRFLDYPGIIIIYRKCYQMDARGAHLTEKHLIGITATQKEIHGYFIDLGNKFVAHPEYQEYDQVYLDLVLETDGKAIGIDPQQVLWEPIREKHLQTMLDLIDLIQKNLTLDINVAASVIIKNYNEKNFQKYRI